jgi:hypothetical protein
MEMIMNRISLKNILIIYSILAMLTGCGATLKTKRFPVTKISDVNGLAVNQPTPHEMIVIFPETSGSKKLIEQQTQQFLTSSTELYTINYCGALFATRQLEVELHGDSSPKKVKVSSTQEIPEALAEFTNTAKSAGEIRKGIEESKVIPDPLIKENESLDTQVRNLMLQANIKAIELGLQPPYTID